MKGEVNCTIHEGHYYRHADGGRYVVIATGLLKNPSTREWVSGVWYQDNQLRNFCRSADDFQKRFVRVGPLQQ